MLTNDMKYIIENFSAGAVATIRPDGTPAVSPKSTFVIIDDETLMFGNLRSPGTMANLRKNPHIEICFTDVLTRKAVRVSGTAKTVRKETASGPLQDAFRTTWPGASDHVSAYIIIDITAVELILSPGYDRGRTEADMKEDFLGKLNRL
jgi:general stress protein 26